MYSCRCDVWRMIAIVYMMIMTTTTTVVTMAKCIFVGREHSEPGRPWWWCCATAAAAGAACWLRYVMGHWSAHRCSNCWLVFVLVTMMLLEFPVEWHQRRLMMKRDTTPLPLTRSSPAIVHHYASVVVGTETQVPMASKHCVAPHSEFRPDCTPLG